MLMNITKADSYTRNVQTQVSPSTYQASSRYGIKYSASIYSESIALSSSPG